ncbi:zf-C2H2 Zinc finger, C2H2 type [Chytriomyces hyalinus]|nr:zf-C2H2 Zinc finger, C2H2 type [Chytriomyces hyalinus]
MLALNRLVDSPDDDENTAQTNNNTQLHHSTLPDGPGPRSGGSPSRQMDIHFMLDHDGEEPGTPSQLISPAAVCATSDIPLPISINEDVLLTTNNNNNNNKASFALAPSHLPNNNQPAPPLSVHQSLNNACSLQGPPSAFPTMPQQPLAFSSKQAAYPVYPVYPVYSHAQLAEQQQPWQPQYQQQQQQHALTNHQHNNHQRAYYNPAEIEYQPQPLSFVNIGDNNNNKNNSNNHSIIRQQSLSASHSPQLGQIPQNEQAQPPPSSSSSSSPQSMPHKRFTCTNDGCGKVFFRKHHLVSHMVSHSTQDKPFKCIIPGCEGTFRRNQDLRRHLRKVKHD